MRTAAVATLNPGSPKQDRNGLHHDLDIEPKAPVLDVLQVELHVAFKRWVRTRSDLPKPGNSRRDIQSPQMFEQIAFEVRHRMWPRTNHAHFAFEYIPQLWEFIKTVAPQKTAKPSDARVVPNLEKRPLPLIAVTQFLPQLVRSRNHGA